MAFDAGNTWTAFFIVATLLVYPLAIGICGSADFFQHRKGESLKPRYIFYCLFFFHSQMTLLETFLNQSSNLLVGFTFAVSASCLGILVAYLGHKMFPEGFVSETSKKIAEAVHNSLLSFMFLLIAFSIGESRQNLSTAEAAATQVAYKLQQFDRDLVMHEVEGESRTRQALADYASNLVTVEWSKFGNEKKFSSDATVDVFVRIAVEIEKIKLKAAQTGVSLQMFRQDLADLEKAHSELLAVANKQVPGIFWNAIAILLIASTLCNVRYESTKLNYVLIAGHMAVIGAAIALLAMLDAPFRGETSVKPVAIERVCARLIAPCAPLSLQSVEAAKQS